MSKKLATTLAVRKRFLSVPCTVAMFLVELYKKHKQDNAGFGQQEILNYQHQVENGCKQREKKS